MDGTVPQRHGNGDGKSTGQLVNPTGEAISQEKTNMTKDIYLGGGVRTAIGAFGGAFEQAPAVVLGSAVVRAALGRAGPGLPGRRAGCAGSLRRGPR